MCCVLQDLYVAHVGDSGAFCIRDGAARRLTIDHKPTNPAEQERIANAGGRVSAAGSSILSWWCASSPWRAAATAMTHTYLLALLLHPYSPCRSPDRKLHCR